MFLTGVIAETLCGVSSDVAVTMATVTQVEAGAADRTLGGRWTGVTAMVAQLRLECVGRTGCSIKGHKVDNLKQDDKGESVA